MLTVNLNYAKLEKNSFEQTKELALDAYKKLLNGAYKNYIGWINLPHSQEEILEQINAFISEFRKKVDKLIVIGIGGSYLGARAVISALKNEFEDTKVIFAGYNISERQIFNLLNYIKDKDFGLCVISKSGTTTEPAIAFRILRDLLIKKYGTEEANKRIIAITSKSDNALYNTAQHNGYKTFFIPSDVGGRYSVLSPVGLVPIAFASVDISKLIEGAKKMSNQLLNGSQNIAVDYAATRNILYNNGYKIELLVSYSPYLNYFSQWWVQLFGESEGKENKGLFPAFANFTTDLHSLGQYIQQGSKILFETVIEITQKPHLVEIPYDENNLDNINYLSGKTLEEVNHKAFLGTLEAHWQGGVPNIIIQMPKLNEYYLGGLIYFFEFSCAVSGITLGVNPFDQPGVEFYKRNMFKLLGKPNF